MLFRKDIITNKSFGKMRFLAGWQCTERITLTLWGREFPVYIRAYAFDQKNLITEAQEKSFQLFIDTIKEKEKLTEKIMGENFPLLSHRELISRFIPEEIIFFSDGAYGLLIGDNEDGDCAVQPDADIAISFAPELKLYSSQEEFLNVFL